MIENLRSLVKEKIVIINNKLSLFWNWLKAKISGRKKYVWVCVAVLIFVFVIILLSQNSQPENKQAQVNIITPSLPQSVNDKKPHVVLEISEPEDDEVTIIDSEKLNVELIEKKLNPKAEEVAKYANEVQVEVYSNSDGILIAPSPENENNNPPVTQKENLSQAIDVIQNVEVIQPKMSVDEEESDLLESTYEEELPEGEYVETQEQDIIPADKETTDKLKGIDISINRKPPYFGEKPVVAVVIDDMGISKKRTSDISSIEAPITSSFLTYSKNLNKQIEVARSAGHEIMLHVPMQAKSNQDAAPDVLTIDMSAAEIAVNFEKMLDKFDNISGVNNHMGSLFTEHADKLAPIMNELRRNKLFFLDSKTSSKSVARDVASDYAVAYVHRHVFLDNVNEKDYVLKQLALTERIAQRNGYAIAIGHPKSATFLALQEWIPTLEQKNIEILPLSKIVKVLNPNTYMNKVD